MRILVHDRYLVTGPDRVRDLATGGELPLRSTKMPAATRVMPALEPLFDALEHGREGEPRRTTLQARDREERWTLADAVADGAQRRGYVPIAVRLYGEARRALGDELRDRAIVLIDKDDAGSEAEACLMDASTISSRPHMLLTLRQPGRTAVLVVREAHAFFGAATARTAPRPHPEVTRLLERAARAPGFILSGRHASAERVLREVSAALERRGAHGEAAGVALELGRMFLERGRIPEADAWGGNTARLAGLAGDARMTCEGHLLQAWSRLELVRLVEAESIARAVLISAPDEAMSLCARATLARCLAEQARRRELAEVRLDSCGEPGVGVVWTAVIHDIAVAALVGSGRLFEAGGRARAALDGLPPDANPLARAILLTAHLRVAVSTGDLALAEPAMRRATDAARQARAPLRALRARAVWFEGLVRAGAAAVAGERARLERLLRAATPLCRREVAGAEEKRAMHTCRAQANESGSVAAEFLALAQEEDDEQAVRAVLVALLAEIDAGRIDVVSSDAGPPSSLLTVGSGPVASVVQRALEAGLAIDTGDGGESAVPIRSRSRLVGAIVARWPGGRVAPVHRKGVLECAAAVIASRVEALQLRAREAAAASVEIPELIGVGRSTLDLRKAVIRAARAPFSVLIEGESGVGKELVARAIHHLSPRRERRFCDINCAALPEDLFETELFGHAKGAFTGAVSDRPGLFEEASGGTLFLDEVADLSPRAQAKLLRAVQQQEVRRVGESYGRSVDVRFVAAANRQMGGEVEAGRFRADLLYRLDVIHIRIAPLRERPEDIPVLARHIWREAAARVGSAATLAPGTLAALAHYQWPGNVRELQNVIAGLAVTAPPSGRVRPSLLPAVVCAAADLSSGQLGPAREQFERRFIERALARTGGNRTRAARALGLSRQGLFKSMARLGLSAKGLR